MNFLSKLSIFFFFIIVLFSCVGEPGHWEDNIKLSTKAVEFSASVDSVIVTTQGDWWLFDVSANNSSLDDSTEINPHAVTFIIKNDWFIIERRNKNTLFVKVAENPLAEKRVLTIGLQSGDYFDRVTFTQKPKE